jgi:trk system potassium uptake protein TrkA
MGQYVVIGLGNFGFNTAISLTKRGNEVLVIDSDPRRIEKIKDLVTDAIIADAREKNILKEFIQPNIDAVIVNLGDTIESSALVTLHLKEIGVNDIIVKVFEEIHGKILKKLGATEIINPEKDTATRLAERLTAPNLIEHIPLAPEYSIVEIALPDKFAGKTLKELQLRNKFNLEVIAVKDVLSEKFKLIPSADYKLEPDNVIIVIGKKEDLAKIKF